MAKIKNLDADAWRRIAQKKRLFLYTEWHRIRTEGKYYPFSDYLSQARENIKKVNSALKKGDIGTAQAQTGIPEISWFRNEIVDADQQLDIYVNRIAKINSYQPLTLEDWEDDTWEIPRRVISPHGVLKKIAFPKNPDVEFANLYEEMIDEQLSNPLRPLLGVLAICLAGISVAKFLSKMLERHSKSVS